MKLKSCVFLFVFPHTLASGLTQVVFCLCFRSIILLTRAFPSNVSVRARRKKGLLFITSNRTPINSHARSEELFVTCIVFCFILWQKFLGFCFILIKTRGNLGAVTYATCECVRTVAEGTGRKLASSSQSNPV